jgi:hypothetical protein
LDKATIEKIEGKDGELVSPMEEKIFKQEFLNLLKAEIEVWKIKYEKRQEKLVLEFISILFENPDIISIFNKKAILLYGREITGLTTKQLVVNMNKFRRKYNNLKKKYFARPDIIIYMSRDKFTKQDVMEVCDKLWRSNGRGSPNSSSAI